MLHHGHVHCVICQTDHADNEPHALVRPGGNQSTGTQVVAPGVSPAAAVASLRPPTPAVAPAAPVPAPAQKAQPPPDADSDPLIGGTVGSFKVVKKLGVGGMGTVYLGEQEFIGSKVAIKVLHPHLASNASLVQRFYAEARAANVIGHEHIVSIIDLNLLPPNRYYFIMEYLEGKSLAELPRPMPHGLLVHILSQVCDALQAAHQNGVVHRDLKPENVILIKRGRNDHFVKILDFGIAKLFATELAGQRTAAGMIMGTPEFMAPEQATAEAVDGRTDLYSVGVIAYELATGRLPFIGKNVADLLIAHRMTTATPPHEVHSLVPEGVSQAIMKALAKSPADRWQTADDFREALQQTMEGLPPWRPSAPTGRTGSTPAFVPSPRTPVVSPQPAPPRTGSNPAFVPTSSASGLTPAFVPTSSTSGSNPGAVPGTSNSSLRPASSSSGLNAAYRASPQPTSPSGFVPTPAMSGGRSPLPAQAPVATTSSGSSATSFEVKVFDGAQGGARILRCTDLSRGGMFVHTDGPLPAMFARFKVAVVLPDGEFALKAEVVRHVTVDQSRAWNMPVGFGVQFVELTPAQRDDLTSLARGVPRWQSAAARPDEKDDARTEEVLATYKKRTTHYELLGVADDADFPEVRQRAREAKKVVAEARERPVSGRQREGLEALDKRLDEASAALGNARNRLDYDGTRSNWKGISRCITGGVSVSELDAARKRYLATHERVEGTAHLHYTTACAWESQREYVRAQGEFERALTLDPLNLAFHQRYQALRRTMLGAKKPGG